MPNVYSKSSWERLEGCHWLLQLIFCEVLIYQDHSILVGHRTEEDQTAAVEAGRSKLSWPHSKHNSTPSEAVDAAPYLPEGIGVQWPDRNSSDYEKQLGQFYLFAGYVQAKADELGVGLRWGGDWDSDRILSDQSFDDVVHFELNLKRALDEKETARLRARWALAVDRLKRRKL